MFPAFLMSWRFDFLSGFLVENNRQLSKLLGYLFCVAWRWKTKRELCWRRKLDWIQVCCMQVCCLAPRVFLSWFITVLVLTIKQNVAQSISFRFKPPMPFWSYGYKQPGTMRSALFVVALAIPLHVFLLFHPYTVLY